MSLDDIWNEPIPSPPKPIQPNEHSSPLKRPRQSLFLSDSDSDYERPPKRATPAPPPVPAPDVDALFADLDKDDEGGDEDDLSYKPLAPSLDLAKLAKEAEARHARGKQGASSQAFPNGSTQPGDAGGKGKDQAGKDSGKGEGEKKGRRTLPKLDEERLVGPDGFPQLIKGIKGFKISGKGHEHQDLNRLMQVYQFWSHKMYPKTSFKDNISRVEKLCHSKRMQVQLSVWRDEFKGVVNGKKAEDEDDPDVIDLTEPTLVGTANSGGDEDSHLQSKSDRESSRTPSLPPTSSEVGDDDDFDIEAAIAAEEERLASLRGTSTSSTLQGSSAPQPPAEHSLRNDPDLNAMDVDEESYWAALDDPPLLDPPQTTARSSAPLDDDEDMWAIVNEIEQGDQPPMKSTKNQIPLSGVNVVASSETASSASGNVSRATNDDDWDEMYS